MVGTLASVDGMGLEAGSKPELITALAVAAPGRTIICNGYKDAPYIRLALSGRKLGLNVVIVIEKPGEWPLIRREARAMGIDPVVGVRLRLSALGTGNWQNTGGERAKFGLNAMQLVELVETLREDEALDALELLHFHMGSQISNLRDIQHGVREAARYYAELRGAGVPIRTVDIGGGLGVDYEGGRSRTFCSMNYSVEQYAQAIVGGLADLCRERELPMPDLVSESGRALTAHHAVLITNVTATERFPRGLEFALESDTHPVVVHLATLLSEVDNREPEECFLEAEHWLEEGRNLFLYGDLPLPDRARLEPLYFAILERVADRLDPDHRRHRELRERIRFLLSDKYFINLSIFQSLPDVWAIDQVFPIVPLQRLDESPTRRAVLEDLTCDSDGRIDQYVERGLLEPTLPVHGSRAARPTCSACSWPAPTRKRSATSTTCSAIPTASMSSRRKTASALRNARPGDTADSAAGAGRVPARASCWPRAAPRSPRPAGAQRSRCHRAAADRGPVGLHLPRGQCSEDAPPPGHMKVGWIGLGAMGAPMAGHLQAGRPALAARGTAVRPAARPSPSRSPRPCWSTPPSRWPGGRGAGAVRVGRRRPGRGLDRVEAQLRPARSSSIIPPSRRPRRARRPGGLRPRDVAFVDAPVTGGVEGAKNGQLAIMAGGDAAACETTGAGVRRLRQGLATTSARPAAVSRPRRSTS